MYILVGALLGALLSKYRYLALALLMVGAVLQAGAWMITIPERTAARRQIDIAYVLNRTTDYQYAVAYRVSNNSPDYAVTNLYFACDGWDSQTTGFEFGPGRIYMGTLKIPYGEQLTHCRPRYQIRKVIN